MKTVLLLMTSAVLFAASTAASWYVQNHVLNKPQPSMSESANSDGPDRFVPSQPMEEIPPTAVREDEMTVEELLRFSLSLKEREKKIIEQEDALQQRVLQQNIVLEDIRSEQQALDGMRSQLKSESKAIQDMLAQLEQVREAIILEREKTQQMYDDIESKQIEISEQFAKNDKKLSIWLQGLEPDKAADVLVEMVNDGKMDVVVQLLSHMEEREAASILGAIADQKLVNDIITAYRHLKEKTKPKR